MKVLLIILIIVFPLVILSYIYARKNTSPANVPVFVATPTPISSNASKTQYTSPNANYTITYPTNFILQPNIETTDQTSNFTYTKNGKTYHFQIIPGGTAGLQAYNQNVDTIVNKILYVNGLQFMESIWYYQNKPFFVQAVPNVEGVTPITFQMDLPDTDADAALQTFASIVQNSQIPQLETPPNPLVTLQAPGVQTISK